jgi:hypothetical protein
MEGTLLLTALLDKDLEIRSLKEENANLRTALDRGKYAPNGAKSEAETSNLYCSPCIGI